MASQHPSLLFFFPDQMRGSAMGSLGQEPVLTPNLDRFEPLVGRWTAWVLTAVLFELLRLFASYTGGAGLVQLLGVTLVLGLGPGYLVQRTGSLCGAVLAHAMADVFSWVGCLAAQV